MPSNPYKRLTWRSRRPSRFAIGAPRSSLLVGEDHLLKVESTIFSESYKRFFFRDIQSVMIKTNRRRMVWNVVLAGLLLLEVVLGTNTGDTWSITMMVMASITVLLLIINNVLGTTCDVHIQTAVQTEDLTPLSRVRRATHALDKLRPLIIQAQGQITPEETVLRLRELTAPPGAKAVAASPTGPLNL